VNKLSNTFYLLAILVSTNLNALNFSCFPGVYEGDQNIEPAYEVEYLFLKIEPDKEIYEITTSMIAHLSYSRKILYKKKINVERDSNWYFVLFNNPELEYATNYFQIYRKDPSRMYYVIDSLGDRSSLRCRTISENEYKTRLIKIKNDKANAIKESEDANVF
tara:strand:+ start:1537 stop:2022 length:486 start_codon:yes stop_codon:yes gene_type:complete